MASKVKGNNSVLPSNFAATMTAMKKNKSAEKIPAQEPAPEKKENKEAQINIRISAAERDELAAFFKSRGIAVSYGLLMAADYVMEGVKSGKLSLSRNGISEK